MSLQLNGINLNSQNFFLTQSGLASSQELSKVANEILSTQQTQQSAAPQNNVQINWDKLNAVDTKLQLAGADAANLQVAKQIANNNAAYGITLSQQALSNIDALRSQAALSSIKNMDGKVFIPAGQFTTSDTKEALAPKSPFQSIDIQDMNKDKKGSRSSYVGIIKKDDDEADKELNLFI